MAARRVQFPQAPQDAPPNADRGDQQDAQQRADGQDVPRGDGNAQRVVYQGFNKYHLIVRGLFKNFKTPNIINKLLASHVYYVGGF